MSCDWLVGEEKNGGVQLYAFCGTCGAKLPVRDGREARAALDWHVLAGHEVALPQLFARAGAA
jgi:hypothetical protein